MHMRWQRGIVASFLSLSMLVVLMLAAPLARATTFEEPLLDTFTNHFAVPWNFFNFEDVNGVFTRTPGLQCGEDACAALGSSGFDRFLRMSVRPTTTAGVYTNEDVSEVPIGFTGAIETGRWNPSVGHPVILNTRVRWSSAYELDGSGAAVGTNGVVLWNSAVDEDGPMPEYDQIGFTWITSRALGGFLAGVTGSAFVDQLPLEPVRPSATLDVHRWINLKLVWSVDAAGVQRVEYFANGDSMGTHVLPEPLRNLSVEIWNDNQEPTFTPDGLANEFPAPPVEQSMDVDSILVRKTLLPRR
jgi:hypothetical protein